MQCNYASPSGSSIWVSGTVVALWYREKSWPETKYCPYQVKLDSRVIPKEQAKSGILIYAPTDEDGCIRADLGATTDGAAVGTAGVGRGHKSVLELRNQ